MASKKLVRLAIAAAISSAEAGRRLREWSEAFQSEYGHSDIADALVEVIDYSSGKTSDITSEFIDRHSNSGNCSPLNRVTEENDHEDIE